MTILMQLAMCSLAAHARPQPAAGAGRQDPLATEAAPAAHVAIGRYRNEEAVIQAVRETLAESPGLWMAPSGTALSGDSYQKFAQQFSMAAKPHCLGPDPMKHQPASTVIGNNATGKWNVGVGGVFALPFWGAAILRGKCSWGR
ncbi:hypothetical protein [Massilia yuzhufengensis]|nr:hypothetical protein [Massilia yuzhufengensis]